MLRPLKGKKIDNFEKKFKIFFSKYSMANMLKIQKMISENQNF
jgi:hypothetical protein